MLTAMLYIHPLNTVLKKVIGRYYLCATPQSGCVPFQGEQQLFGSLEDPPPPPPNFSSRRFLK